MNELKVKHYFLFLISFILIWYFKLTLGPLLLLFAWQQMTLLIWHRPLTKQNQLKMLINSLMLLPLFIFTSGIMSFTQIYLHEKSFLLFLGSGLLGIIMIFFILVFGLIFPSHVLPKADSKFIQNVQLCLNEIKNTRLILFQLCILFFVIALNPFFEIDLNLILGLMACHFRANYLRQKLAF